MYIFRSSYSMSFGFVTASGKNVKVSKEALQKAKDFLGKLNTDDGSSADSCISPLLSHSDATTPLRSSSKRFCLGRGQFKPSAFVSPLSRSNSPSTSTSCRKTPNGGVASPLRETSSLNTPETSSASSTPISASIRSNAKSVTPIKLLTPYCRNWRLCVKVSEIEGTRCFRGMEIFSFLAADSSGIEVRVTAFNDLVHKTAATVSVGKMYYITKASLKPVNKRFGGNNIDTEVIVRPDTEIIPCTDQPSIASPKIRFVFVRLKNIMNFLDREIDLIGIIHEVGEVRQTATKNSEVMQRRDVEIVDDTGYSVSLLLWGDRAAEFCSSVSQIIAVKRAFARTYQGVMTVTTMSSSKIVVDPDLAETRSLSSWYRAHKNDQFSPVSARCFLTFEEQKWIRDVKYTGTPQYFSIVALILNINSESATYKGCKKCRKKLVQFEGAYRCTKCGATSSDFKFFYSLNLEVCDFTGSRNISVFNDCAEKLLKEPADEVAKFINYNYDRYRSYFKKVLFKKYLFRITARAQENIPITSITNTKDHSLPAPIRWSLLDFAEVPYDAYLNYLRKCLESHSLSVKY